ncbi:hypothetical protein U91I_03877 [alpha proteobacterium U9-1i]|nr:hypothetical protein U91I_03877 [alpha proteobacterium U9-1i]
MTLQNYALIAAGLIGSVTAIVHGVLTQRFMVAPLDKIAAENHVSGQIRRLNAALLHYSTASWLACGLALIGAALWLDDSARFATALFAGGHFLYGVIGNAWATRWRHPGWMLLALAVALIGYGLS